ncbi:MAG: nuclear transport factor 2 family protein [Deltaproteobacteria bacterium]|nr:nuclear transport factor 2 family protein [Deltaproteobacteria bacterium]
MQPRGPSAGSTAPGWTPAPARTTTTLILLRPKAEETRSRRRVYFMLGGIAVGLGAGVGVMVSSTASKAPVAEIASGSSSSPTPATPKGSAGAMTSSGSAAGQGSAVIASQSGSAGSASAGSGSVADVAPNVPIRSFLAAQRDSIAKADARGLVEHVAPTAFAFGTNADDVAEGRVAIEAMLARNLADAPPDGFTVTSKFQSIGEARNHAWVAEELEVSDGSSSRRIAITQLCAFVGGAWTTVALHWGEPVPDALAERRAILGTLPRPGTVQNKADGGSDLDQAVRVAFASRTAFVDARSERDDAFNFGSGPNERSSGAAVKRLFARLRSELKLVGGARVVAGSTWDPAQATAPWIGFAAFNADYTYKSRAATDLTQTFRVLAILIREGEGWAVVQTQFSNAGPVN